VHRPNDIELTIILHASPVLKNFPSPLPHVRRAVFVSGRILGVTTELPQLAVLDLYAVRGREKAIGLLAIWAVSQDNPLLLPQEHRFISPLATLLL